MQFIIYSLCQAVSNTKNYQESMDIRLLAHYIRYKIRYTLGDTNTKYKDQVPIDDVIRTLSLLIKTEQKYVFILHILVSIALTH